MQWAAGGGWWLLETKNRFIYPSLSTSIAFSLPRSLSYLGAFQLGWPVRKGDLYNTPGSWPLPTLCVPIVGDLFAGFFVVLCIQGRAFSVLGANLGCG